MKNNKKLSKRIKLNLDIISSNYSELTKKF